MTATSQIPKLNMPQSPQLPHTKNFNGNTSCGLRITSVSIGDTIIFLLGLKVETNPNVMHSMWPTCPYENHHTAPVLKWG